VFDFIIFVSTPAMKSNLPFVLSFVMNLLCKYCAAKRWSWAPHTLHTSFNPVTVRRCLVQRAVCSDGSRKLHHDLLIELTTGPVGSALHVFVLRPWVQTSWWSSGPDLLVVQRSRPPAGPAVQTSCWSRPPGGPVVQTSCWSSGPDLLVVQRSRPLLESELLCPNAAFTPKVKRWEYSQRFTRVSLLAWLFVAVRFIRALEGGGA